MIRYIIKKILNKFGYEIRRKFDLYHSWDAQLSKHKLLQVYDIDLIFDIGANIGGYAKALRYNDYKGRIISFEPLIFAHASVYEQLLKAAKNDPLWETSNIALGDKDSKCIINVSGERETGDTSSIHKANSNLIEIIGNANQNKTQEITMHKLDTIIDKYYRPGNRLFLKADTQGYEKQIIDGALNSLNKIMGMELELSLKFLYEDESLFIDMVIFLSKIGYTLVSITPRTWNHYTGQVMQVWAIFFRTGLKPTKLPTPNTITKLGYPKMYF